MPNNLTFMAACSCANGATHLLGDQSTLLNTSKNCSWEYRECLERGNNADPAIDYDPLRLMSRSDAKLAPPTRFWRAVARRMLERQGGELCKNGK